MKEVTVLVTSEELATFKRELQLLEQGLQMLYEHKVKTTSVGSRESGDRVREDIELIGSMRRRIHASLDKV